MAEPARPHSVAKLYYIAWPESTWAAYQTAVWKPSSTVDGVERQATPWPDWAITTVIEGWVREHPEQWLWLHRRWR